MMSLTPQPTLGSARAGAARTLGMPMALLCIGALLLGLAGCASAPKPRTLTVNGEVFDLSGLPPQRADLVVAGLSQMGTPYVYGGSAPGQALDCSGLTLHAHRAVGVDIPRVSMAQKAASRALRGPPRPGDLVFFQTGPSAYHVGLMVDAERFVHASTSKRQVRLARLNSDYWRQRFLGAGTFLD